MKLVDLARESTRLLKESGPSGIRSDVLAEILGSPKRRVYDIIAVLKSLDLVRTIRRFDGTTVTWIDRSAEFVSRQEYEEIRASYGEVDAARKDLQVQVAELKQQVRMTKSRLRRESQAIEAVGKTEFSTTQLRVRALSSNGFKRVRDSGMEVVIETHMPGMIVDPTEEEADHKEALMKKIQV